MHCAEQCHGRVEGSFTSKHEPELFEQVLPSPSPWPPEFFGQPPAWGLGRFDWYNHPRWAPTPPHCSRCSGRRAPHFDGKTSIKAQTAQGNWMQLVQPRAASRETDGRHAGFWDASIWVSLLDMFFSFSANGGMSRSVYRRLSQ